MTQSGGGGGGCRKHLFLSNSLKFTKYKKNRLHGLQVPYLNAKSRVDHDYLFIYLTSGDPAIKVSKITIW